VAELMDIELPGKINTVLVDASRVSDLKAAYPNYFGDVQLFCHSLKSILGGNRVKEYAMPPQQAAPRLHTKHRTCRGSEGVDAGPNADITISTDASATAVITRCLQTLHSDVSIRRRPQGTRRTAA
jgi:hypothetical protein